MKKIGILNGVNKMVNKAGFKLKKHSPEIFIAAGVTGVIASAVMACHATTKLSGILDDSREAVEDIHHAMEHPEELPEDYTVEDGKKDLVIVYTQTAIKLAKLYAPSVILGGLSIAAILKSNNILSRNVEPLLFYTNLYLKEIKELWNLHLHQKEFYRLMTLKLCIEISEERAVNTTVRVIEISHW